MSQDIFSDIDPTVTTGLMLSALLTDFKDAVVSGFSGDDRPVLLQEGGLWVDTSQESAPNYLWTLRLWDGTTDHEILQINVLSGITGANYAAGTFTIRRISADNTAAILNFIKQRVEDSGQDLDGDTLMEIKWVGRTNSATDPVVAYIKASADDDMTASVSGANLLIASTPAGSNSVQDHLQFIDGLNVSLLPHNFTALIYGQDTTAATSSMILSDDKIVTELTGATAAVIHGIEADTTGTRVKAIFNAGTSIATVVEQSGTASASQQIRTPGDLDFYIRPGECAWFYYCETDTKWKFQGASAQKPYPRIETFFGSYNEWVAPITGRVRVTGYSSVSRFVRGTSTVFGFSRLDGSFLSCGANTSGQLGVGDVASRSSPVAVLGGIKFNQILLSSVNLGGFDSSGDLYIWGSNSSAQIGDGTLVSKSSPVAVLGGHKFASATLGSTVWALKSNGEAYAWGANSNGQLGLGDVTPRSSPVAVLGGIKFSNITTATIGGTSFFGISRETGLAYAWGDNPLGVLGVGDVTPRSSPVAVLGGIKFSKIVCSSASVVGISTTGVMYAWGSNLNGELGTGDITPRSSPVAVLGGLTVVDVYPFHRGFLARTSTGQLYAWGRNESASGELGVGDTASRSSPVAVLGGFLFRDVKTCFTSGSGYALAATLDGTLYAWGNNQRGQLGLGDVTPRSSPVAVLGGLKFSDFYAYTGTSSYGSASDGSLYAWGINTNGQLGVGDVTSRSSPVAVIGGEGLYFQTPSPEGFIVSDVVAGTTYKLILGGSMGEFNGLPLGTNLAYATIGYE